jgi:crotonobetainyl-CoA:carnitine CoA-transferase CaiB-like acyl-CoA transferase
VAEHAPRPLDGVRVLDLTHVMAGPYTTMFMAMNGAEVIKIERREGEIARRLLIETPEGRRVDATIAYLNRGKKAITLNLQSAEGRALFLDLVRISDVVVENFTARTMQRLGLGYDVLREANPRIVYTSLSGFGHDDVYEGPYVDRPAFNMIAQAMSGIMDITGELERPPVPTGVAIGDLAAGIFALSGTLLALRHRERTGVGQHVDVALYDSLVSFSQRAVLRTFLTGDVPTRGRDNRENPQGPFKVKDGYVAIVTMGDPMWERLCNLIGRPDLRDDPRFNPDTARGRRFDDVIRPLLEAWAKDMTRDEVVRRFLEVDLPAAPVQNAGDLLGCPQLRSRRMVYEVDDPQRGRLAYTGNPIKLSNVPDVEPAPAAALGEDTEQVLGELLGLGRDDIERLRERNVL